MSHVNFTQSNLYGANLSGAQLFNAIFNNARLLPSANGKATNLSNANLQGADFTDATLYGTNLANAATAINVPTKVIAKQGGVYLFSLPYSDDKATLAQYTTELDAATTGFTLPYNGDPTTLDQYEAALNSNNVAPPKALASFSPAECTKGTKSNPQKAQIIYVTFGALILCPFVYSVMFSPTLPLSHGGNEHEKIIHGYHSTFSSGSKCMGAVQLFVQPKSTGATLAAN